MTTDDTSGQNDPIAWLLMYIREARRQGAALHDPANTAAALAFFQAQLPGYRRVLEQALFPLLKRRLRDDDDEGEEALRQAIFLASGTLLAWEEQLPALLSLPTPNVKVARTLMTSFSNRLDLHLEKMETVILPAVPAHLGKCDIALLASSLRRHPAHTPCPSTHSTENVHDAR